MRPALKYSLAALLLLGSASAVHSQDAGAPEAQATAAAAAAQIPDSVLDAQTRAIASVLRCPVCQGESIQASPSELAQQMRAVVREQLREGRTPEEIKAYFVERYGEWILLKPAMTGLNVLLYAFPVLVVLGGIAIVTVVVKRWTAPAERASG